MGATDIPSGHEKVPDVTRIKAAVWNRIRMNPVMHGRGLEFIARKFPGVFRIGEMQVNAPSSGK